MFFYGIVNRLVNYLQSRHAPCGSTTSHALAATPSALGSLDDIAAGTQRGERTMLAQQPIHGLHRERTAIARQAVGYGDQPVILRPRDELAHALGGRHGGDAGGAVAGMG